MRSRRKSKDTLKQVKMRIQQSKICGTLAYLKKKKQTKKQEKTQTILTSHLKELEKEQQTKPTVSRRKEIIKIRAEINEIESKKK